MEGIYGISSRGIVNYRDKAGVGTTQPLSLWNISMQNIKATQDDSYGLMLSNPTLAIAGTQQYSPPIVWQGNGQATTPGTPQDVRFRGYVVPVQGTANPTGYLSFGSSINGAAYSNDQMIFTSGGGLIVGGIAAAQSGALIQSMGTIYWGASAQGRLTVSGNDIYIDAALGSGGINFRTNGSTQAATLTSTQRLGLGTVTSPTSTFQTLSYAVAYIAKTANYTATISDCTIDCTSNTFTVTLPTAVGIGGRIYNIKNSGTGTITIATTSSQTIDGVTTKTLNVQYTGFQFQSDNANWKIIAVF